MATQQWRPDSAFSSGGGGSAGFLAGSSMTAILGGAVAAGELVCQVESGAVIRANPFLPWGVLNNVTSGLTSSYSGAITAINTGLCTVGHSKKLSNGNVVVPIQQSTGIGFLIRTPVGQQIVAFTQATTDTTAVQIPHVVALSAGGFFLVWCTSSTVKFRVYDNYGNAQAAAVTVASSLSTTANDTFFVAAQVAGGGNVVVVWSTSSAIVGQAFTTAGATSGTQFTVAGVQGDTLAIFPCANGDLLISFAAVSGTLFNLYRISSAGAAIWGPVAPSSATSRYTITNSVENQLPSGNRLIELAATNYIVITLPDSAGAPAVYILNSAGTVQHTLTTTGLSQTSNCPGTIALTPEGFAFVFAASNGQTTPYVYYFDTYGTPLVQHQIKLAASPPSTAANPNTAYYAVWAGTGLAIVGCVAGQYLYLGLCDAFGNLLPYQGYVQTAARAASSGYTQQTNLTIGPTGQPLFTGNVLANGGDGYAYATTYVAGTPAVPASVPTYSLNNTDLIGTPVPICGPDGLLFLTYSDRTSAKIMIDTYITCRSSVLGVAASGGSLGSSVTINGAGGFQLPSTQLFGAPTSFDQRAAPIWGARGVVGGIPGSGSFANLAGWL